MTSYLRSIQSFTIPTTYEDVPQTVAAKQILRISDCHAGGYYFAARAHTLVLPFFVGLAVIQQATLLLSDTLSHLSGEPRKITLVQNDETKTETVSPKDDLKELMRAVLACATTILIFPFAFCCPNVHAREKLNELPPTAEGKRLKEIGARHDQALSDANQRVGRFWWETRTLCAEWFEGIDEGNGRLWFDRLNKMKGLGIHLPIEITKYGASTSTGSLDAFFLPEGLLELSIDCTHLTLDQFQALLAKPHKVGRLKLIHPTQAEIDALTGSSALTLTHSLALVLHPERPLNLSKIDTNCPRIVFLDLFGETLPPYPKGHLFRFTRKDGTTETNQQDLLEDFDRQKDSLKAVEFPSDHWLHPVTPFMTTFDLFAGSDLTTIQLSSIQTHFPHATTYDFRRCRRLEFTVLDLLSEAPPAFLLLDGLSSKLVDLLPKLDLLFQNGSQSIILTTSIQEEVLQDKVIEILRSHTLPHCGPEKKLELTLKLFHSKTHRPFQIFLEKENGKSPSLSKIDQQIIQRLTARDNPGCQTARVFPFPPRYQQARSLSVPPTSRGAARGLPRLITPVRTSSPAAGSSSPVPRLNFAHLPRGEGAGPAGGTGRHSSCRTEAGRPLHLSSRSSSVT